MTLLRELFAIIKNEILVRDLSGIIPFPFKSQKVINRMV